MNEQTCMLSLNVGVNHQCAFPSWHKENHPRLQRWLLPWEGGPGATASISSGPWGAACWAVPWLCRESSCSDNDSTPKGRQLTSPRGPWEEVQARPSHTCWGSGHSSKLSSWELQVSQTHGCTLPSTAHTGERLPELAFGKGSVPPAFCVKAPCPLN